MRGELQRIDAHANLLMSPCLERMLQLWLVWVGSTQVACSLCRTTRPRIDMRSSLGAIQMATSAQLWTIAAARGFAEKQSAPFFRLNRD